MRNEGRRLNRFIPLQIIMCRYRFVLVLVFGMMVSLASGKDHGQVDLSVYQWKPSTGFIPEEVISEQA